MNYIEQLNELIKKNKGILLTSDVTAAGIPRVYLAQLVNSGKLERIARGIYATKDALIDSMHLLQVKYPSVIFSHTTALFLHELTDRDPLQYEVTVPTGYNATNIKNSGVKVYFIKKKYYALGKTRAQTSFGRTINTYNMERTICDILRNRNEIDVAIVSDALKRYVKQKNKNLHQLMEYAENLRVAKILRNYMEVLL